jgi:branched-chain amino acid transport system permease protein
MSVLLSEPVQALIAINALLTLSLLFPFLAGVWSLGLPGFMAVGAYSSAYLTYAVGVPIPVAFVAGTLLGALISVPFGLLALRVRGIYLAIATLAAAELITLFFSHYELTGGVMGYTGMPYVEAHWLLLLLLTVFVLSVWIYRSRLGKVLKAVGSDPTVAACNGINVAYIQLIALAIGGGIAGLAGACFAHYYSFISPANFGFDRTVDILMFLVIGGLTPLGAVVGSAGMTLIPQYITALERWAPALYGAIVMMMMAWMPGGLLSGNRRKLEWRPWRRGLASPSGPQHADDDAAPGRPEQAGDSGIRRVT